MDSGALNEYHSLVDNFWLKNKEEMSLNRLFECCNIYSHGTEPIQILVQGSINKQPFLIDFNNLLFCAHYWGLKKSVPQIFKIELINSSWKF